MLYKSAFRTLLLFLMLFAAKSLSAHKTIHVFVSLCDNQYQGIVPVSQSLGDGQNPNTNLYWGAAYGFKTFFTRKAPEWKLVRKLESKNDVILERLLFKHRDKDLFLLAEAYDGQQIQACTKAFLQAMHGHHQVEVTYGNTKLNFGAASDLLAYCGHNGLMDFSLAKMQRNPQHKSQNEVVILACYSAHYFSSFIESAQAKAMVLTTNLMAPEAYTLRAILEEWSESEGNSDYPEVAAAAYHQYQKCGMRGARALFTQNLKL